ncbi:hypothetical protein Hypma_010453 [Hypsizygus marmoreus]|uniref:Uncharacterized protein n=1 Tax=Hypsizygus marmoreus TaxID=39966 RepID=A0A369KC24_HYPMA|nr:hypothetical protein Hypma_010453 [Hypsizygus marmoreus]
MILVNNIMLASFTFPAALVALSSSSTFAHPIHNSDPLELSPPSRRTAYRYRVKARFCKVHHDEGFSPDLHGILTSRPCYHPTDVAADDQEGYGSTVHRNAVLEAIEKTFTVAGQNRP